LKIATFEHQGVVQTGILLYEHVVSMDYIAERLKIPRRFPGVAKDLLDLLAHYSQEDWEKIEKLSEELTPADIQLLARNGQAYHLREVKLKAPIQRPPLILCLGVNYRAHASECNKPVPSEPVIFSKSPTAVIGPEEYIVLPKISSRVDYEVEFAAITGRPAKNVSKEEALDYVFGYTVFNDVTARDIQQADFKEGKPWFRSKSCDTFAPMGPWVVTRREHPYPSRVKLELKVNGVVKQSATTADMVFDLATIIEHISKFLTLPPGTVIATGTPEGIGPLHDGDLVEAYVEGIGTLRNPVKAEK